MPFCPSCGNQVSETSNFCAQCGTNLKQPANANNTANQGFVTDSGIKIISQSDPVFRVKCEHCLCTFEYKLANLGYRAWYPNGFVYCPQCNQPIRHHAEYQVK